MGACPVTPEFSGHSYKLYVHRLYEEWPCTLLSDHGPFALQGEGKGWSFRRLSAMPFLGRDFEGERASQCRVDLRLDASAIEKMYMIFVPVIRRPCTGCVQL